MRAKKRKGLREGKAANLHACWDRGAKPRFQRDSPVVTTYLPDRVGEMDDTGDTDDERTSLPISRKERKSVCVCMREEERERERETGQRFLTKKSEFNSCDSILQIKNPQTKVKMIVRVNKHKH